MFDCSELADRGVSPHRALCWLIREAVDRRGGGGAAKGRYKRAYRDAEDALKARGACFTPLDGERLDMLIAKPNAELLAAEVETLGLIAGLLLEDFSPAEADDLKARAVERARTQPGASAHGHSVEDSDWAELFSGAWRERQALMSELAGEYLIFRQNARGPRHGLIVSHMTIAVPPGADAPARFRTVGAGFGKDERVVEGRIFEMDASHGVLYSIGRDRETAQMRNALFMPVAKPEPGWALRSDKRDLKGVRLGLGRVTGEPGAYRIWCSSLTEPLPDGADWRSTVKDYGAGESLAVFERAVPGFGYIRRWLDRPVACTLDDDDDPPTP
jgi:hypothetical protein